MAFVISLLSGEAAQREIAEWETKFVSGSSIESFPTELRRVFDPLKPSEEAGVRLPCIKQGNRSANCFAIEFRTLAANTTWNESALFNIF